MATFLYAAARRQEDPMQPNMQVNNKQKGSKQGSGSLKRTSSQTDSPEDEGKELKLAECGKQLRSGVLEKKIAGTIVTWKTQGVVLTDRMICFLNDDGVIEDDESVIDYIPLHEVIQLMMESENKSEREEKLCLIIRTAEGGHNSGRTYVYRMKTEAECVEWHKEMSTGLKLALKARRREAELEEIGDSKYLWLRFQAKKLIKSRKMHIVMSVLIFLNFFVDIYDAESLPDSSSTGGKFVQVTGILVTVFFTVEVSVAAFAMSENNFKPFYSDPWNIMDLVVVVVSLVAIPFETDPQLKVLGLVRIFRVALVFRQVKSLNRIMTALGGAVVPLLNAFMLLLLVSCFYAILGTHLFKDYDKNFFGSFSASLFTMFQIMTGDSWASSISRTLFDEVGPDDAEMGNLNRRVALFSISYVIIATIILVNIVVAVLLDEFISSVTREKEEQARQLQEQRELEAKASRISGVLDPLLVSISSFNDNVDLSARIAQLYKMLDADGGGGLDFHELNAGLKQLPLPTPIHLTLDDYDIITEGGKLCQEDGEFDAEQFQAMMKGELKRYAQRCVANAMSETERKEDHSLLFMLKLLTMTVDEIHAGMRQMEKQQAEVEGVGEKVERMCKELGDIREEIRKSASGLREDWKKKFNSLNGVRSTSPASAVRQFERRGHGEGRKHKEDAVGESSPVKSEEKRKTVREEQAQEEEAVAVLDDWTMAKRSLKGEKEHKKHSSHVDKGSAISSRGVHPAGEAAGLIPRSGSLNDMTRVDARLFDGEKHKRHGDGERRRQETGGDGGGEGKGKSSAKMTEKALSEDLFQKSADSLLKKFDKTRKGNQTLTTIHDRSGTHRTRKTAKDSDAFAELVLLPRSGQDSDDSQVSQNKTVKDPR